jgi:hypothetical protein
MGPEPFIRTVGRTVVVGSWLLALVVAGRPAWAAIPLGMLLVLVWASPYMLLTNRRAPLPRVGARPPVVGPQEAGPAS